MIIQYQTPRGNILTHTHTTDTSHVFGPKYIRKLKISAVHDYFFYWVFFLVQKELTHGEPSNADNNVQTPLFSSGVLERPHAVPVHVPEGARCRVHASLADFLGASGGGFVDDALLDNGAVYRESVGRWGGVLVGCGCNDEVF
jgi:hypothetical protein